MGHWEQIGQRNRELRKSARNQTWQTVLATFGAVVLWGLILRALLW